MDDSASFATIVPVAHALWEAPVEFLHKTIPWQATEGNYLQELMLRKKQASLALAHILGSKVLRSKASNDCSVVNQFLTDEEFHLQLTDQGKQNMIYVATVMKLLGHFFEKGSKGYFLPKIGKKAFRLGKEANVRHYVYQRPGWSVRVVEIPTGSGFSLLVSTPSSVRSFAMVEDWGKVIFGMQRVPGNGVILPMAQVDETEMDVKQLVGMAGGEWMIQEAKAAVKFALTPEMVKYEAAVAYSAKRAAMERLDPEAGDYLADHPLYFGLAIHGYLLPLATGYVPVNLLANTYEID